MKKIPSILCSLVLIVAGTQAHATWKQIQISGTITNNGGGLLGPIVNVNVGDSFDLSLIVDSADPDTNPATGAYHSLNDALVDTVFIVAIKGKAPVLTTGSTQWLTQGNLDLTGVQPGLYLPFTATLNGTGMTLDQVLPNFTPGSITTSPNDIVVDLTPLWIQGG